MPIPNALKVAIALEAFLMLGSFQDLAYAASGAFDEPTTAIEGTYTRTLVVPGETPMMVLQDVRQYEMWQLWVQFIFLLALAYGRVANQRSENGKHVEHQG